MRTAINARTWGTKIKLSLFGSALLVTVLKVTANRITAQVKSVPCHR